MVQEVSRRHLTAENWLWSLIQDLWWTKRHSVTGRGFSPSSSVFPLSVSFHRWSILIFTLILRAWEGKAGKIWERLAWNNGQESASYNFPWQLWLLKSITERAWTKKGRGKGLTSHYLNVTASEMLKLNAHSEGLHIIQILSHMTSDNTVALSSISSCDLNTSVAIIWSVPKRTQMFSRTGQRCVCVCEWKWTERTCKHRQTAKTGATPLSAQVRYATLLKTPLALK